MLRETESSETSPSNIPLAAEVASKPLLTLAALLLAVVTFWTYIPAMSAGFIWDDDDYITANPALGTLDGLWQIWLEPGATPQYYPMVFTSFWVEHQLWQFNPAGYHVVNIGLHALAAVLLWLVLARITLPGGPLAAWLAAAIFAIHPVQVESVAWISERKNVLSAVFYFAALLMYLRFDRRLNEGSARVWPAYLLAHLLFLFALLSKTVTCSLPAAILLVIWWKRGSISRRDLALTAPMFALGAAFALLTLWLEKHHVGAQGDEWNLSIGDRCILAGRNIWFYAQKLAWPTDLAFVYQRWNIEAFDWRWWLHPVSVIAIAAAMFALRHRIGRGPLVAMLFFIGTLTPALGFFDVYPFRFSFVADHFQYLACIGLIGLAVASSFHLFPGRRFIGALWLIVIAALGVQSWKQAHIYRDLETLWRDTLAKNPNSFMPHYNLGNALLGQGHRQEALEHYRRALELKPDLTPALNNIGVELARAGQNEQAIQYFQRAINSQPDYVLAMQGDRTARIDRYLIDSLHGLGTAHARARQLDQAVHFLSLAVSLDSQPPRFAEPRIDLAIALVLQSRHAEAERFLLEALNIDPDNARAASALRNLRQLMGR